RQKDRWHLVDGQVTMLLLEDGTDIDHGVGVGTRWREALDRRRVRLQELAQRPGAGVSARGVVLVGEDVDAPSARATWPRWTGLASANRTTGAEWKRIPTAKPSARCWKIASALIIDGAYLVATPAVKRPCAMKYCWNSCGSTPSPSA